MHPPHDDYEKLNTFLKEKLSLGYGVDAIKGSLVKVGWDEALVSSLLRDQQQERADATAAYSAEAIASIRAFIAEELQHGHSKEQIRAALLKTGWQAKIVDEELARR
jgi:SOS response regulatory protein OraA/RecX